MTQQNGPSSSRLVTWTLRMFGAAALVTWLADLFFDVNYKLAANTALLVAALLVSGFTALYAVRSRWWANRIGCIYLVKCVVLSLVLDQIVLAAWWDEDYPFRQQIRFLIYAFGALVYIPMLITLWREQQRDRCDPDKVDPVPPALFPPL